MNKSVIEKMVEMGEAQEDPAEKLIVLATAFVWGRLPVDPVMKDSLGVFLMTARAHRSMCMVHQHTQGSCLGCAALGKEDLLELAQSGLKSLKLDHPELFEEDAEPMGDPVNEDGFGDVLQELLNGLFGAEVEDG